jgi:hypothetical protein
MRHIQWNKVTWYSKALAMFVFITFPIVFFYFGIIYGEANAIRNMPKVRFITTTVPMAYENISQWNQYSNEPFGFLFKYPMDLTLEEFGSLLSKDWRGYMNGAYGAKILELTVPKAIEPMSNFSGAKFTIGASDDPAAVANCLEYNQESFGLKSSTSETIKGTTYKVFRGSDAGAGNIYDTTSFHTIKGGRCIVAEYTIHSTNIDNYPVERGVRTFDETRIILLLERVMHTLEFTSQ